MPIPPEGYETWIQHIIDKPQWYKEINDMGFDAEIVDAARREYREMMECKKSFEDEKFQSAMAEALHLLVGNAKVKEARILLDALQVCDNPYFELMRKTIDTPTFKIPGI